MTTTCPNCGRPGYDEPPLYANRCKRHGRVADPGNCGNCKDVREAAKADAERFPDYRLRVVPDLCGECDERWIETEDGWAKCPNCYPKERTA